MDIRILDRDQASRIDPEAWDALADESSAPNPFYERWNLLPALRFLDTEAPVVVVAGYDRGRLSALFPLRLEPTRLLFRQAAVWRFHGCHRTDALCLPGVSLDDVLREAMERARASVLISATHGERGHALSDDLGYCRKRRMRKAVTRFEGWEHYACSLSGKRRKENNRIVRRLTEGHGATYETGETAVAERWLPIYLDVESRSWKAKHGQTIGADAARRQYFHEVMCRGEQSGKIAFQGIFMQGQAIAVSFRYLAQACGYEIKTVYTEQYRQLYPGVVLELLNIRDILDRGYELVDSCATHNEAVDRIWPDEIPLYRTVLFSRNARGRLTRAAYERLQTAAEREPWIPPS